MTRIDGDGTPVPPLGKSAIWELQQKWYDEHGMQAWLSAKLPYFVSSNAYTANQYAKLIIAHAWEWHRDGAGQERDAAGPAGSDAKFYIIEVGAGHGRLAFMVMAQLQRLQEHWPRPDCFCYVLTDSSRSYLEYWNSHKMFAPHFMSGFCDLAVFDAERDDEILLQRSGVRLAANTSHLPMFFLCNYVFSALRQEHFVFGGDQQGEDLPRLKRVHIEASIPTASASETKSDGAVEPDSQSTGTVESVTSFTGLECKWHTSPCDVEEIVREYPEAEGVIRECLTNAANTTMGAGVPIGGIRCIDNLRRLCQGRMTCVVSDKAFSHPVEFERFIEPHVAVDQCFSLMVNLHALASNVVQKGGLSLQTQTVAMGFKSAAFIFGRSADQFSDFCLEWETGLRSVDIDSLITYERCAFQEMPQMTLRGALSLLRISCWDADIFYRLRRVILKHLGDSRGPQQTVSEKQQIDIRTDALNVWESYYHMRDAKDVPFELGRVMMGIREYAQAILFFQRSIDLCGPHHVTSYNIGICKYYQNKLSEAMHLFDTVSSRAAAAVANLLTTCKQWRCSLHSL